MSVVPVFQRSQEAFMQVCLLKGKIHRRTVTEADLGYEGSVTTSADLSPSPSPKGEGS